MAKVASTTGAEGRKVRDKVYDLGSNLELWRVHVDELIEQARNARVMDPKTFKRLSSNIGKDSRLEQLPFCALRGDVLEIVSGHHRVRAARAAGVTEIFILVDTSGLTRSEVVAKQLAHNAIQGADDVNVLKELFGELSTPADILESHIDPDLLTVPEPQPLTDVKLDLDWRLVSLVFLPSGLKDFTQVVERLSGDEAMVGLCDLKVLPKFRETMAQVTKTYDIRAMGAALSKMCDIVHEHLRALDQEEES